YAAPRHNVVGCGRLCLSCGKPRFPHWREGRNRSAADDAPVSLWPALSRNPIGTKEVSKRMAERILGPTKSRRRRRFLLGPVLLVVFFGLIAISSASGVLTGSPSKFESGNDPTLGLGNMIVNTTGNTGWVSVAGETN